MENATKLMKLWSQNMVAEFTRFVSMNQESEFNCEWIHCADWACSLSRRKSATYFTSEAKHSWYPVLQPTNSCQVCVWGHERIYNHQKEGT